MLLSLTIACCATETPDTDDSQVEYTEDIEFSLEIVSVEAGQAQIKVSHNGTDDDTWYGFATTADNITYAMYDKIDELMQGGDKVSGLMNGTGRTVTVDKLEGETEYKFVVFAVREDGEPYGNTSMETFTTPKAETQYRRNPAWKVEYTGSQEIKETTYDHTVTVTSTDDNTFFMNVLPFDEFDETDIKEIIADEIAYMHEYIAWFNSNYGVESTFSNWITKESKIDAFGLTLGYEYIAIAIGADENGEPTGLYAVSEPFFPTEEEMSEAYASWIGDWTFTGANGVAFDITFRKDVSNRSFVTTGWDPQQPTSLEVLVDWYPEDNMWIAFAQYIGTFTFKEDNGTVDGDIWFAPFDADGKAYLHDSLPCLIGGDLSEGSRMAVSYSEQGLTFDHVEFVGKFHDGLAHITTTTEFPTFPITVTPAQKTAIQSAESERPVHRKTQTPKPVFGQIYR